MCRGLPSDFARLESMMCVDDSLWQGNIRDASRRLKRHLAHVETRVELVEA